MLICVTISLNNILLVSTSVQTSNIEKKVDVGLLVRIRFSILGASTIAPSNKTFQAKIHVTFLYRIRSFLRSNCYNFCSKSLFFSKIWCFGINKMRSIKRDQSWPRNTGTRKNLKIKQIWKIAFFSINIIKIYSFCKIGTIDA